MWPYIWSLLSSGDHKITVVTRIIGSTWSFLTLYSNSCYVLWSSLHDSHEQCHYNRDTMKLEVGHSCVTVLWMCFDDIYFLFVFVHNMFHWRCIWLLGPRRRRYKTPHGTCVEGLCSCWCTRTVALDMHNGMLHILHCLGEATLTKWWLDLLVNSLCIFIYSLFINCLWLLCFSEVLAIITEMIVYACETCPLCLHVYITRPCPVLTHSSMFSWLCIWLRVTYLRVIWAKSFIICITHRISLMKDNNMLLRRGYVITFAGSIQT